jgi:hypothetical protein
MRVTIPTSLKDVPLHKWNEIQEVYAISESETLTKLKVISIICNMSFELVSTIEINDIDTIYNSIDLMFQEAQNIEHFVINGISFGFIPNLETVSGGEFIDLENYLKDDIFKAMAVIYRPIKNKNKELYSIEKYKGADKYSELMKMAPTSAYIAATVFFYNLLNDLLSAMPDYMSKNLTDSELQTLESNGVGIFQLTQLLTTID